MGKVTDEKSYHRYSDYSKPGLSRALRAFGLDIAFHRGEADYLFYHDKQGNEKKVLDLVGGFGALFWGHNFPEIVKTLQEESGKNYPNLAQASIRAGAALLAERIAEIAKQKLGEDYLVSFANSGAEAVEAALKHLVLIKTAALEAISEQILLSTAAILRRREQPDLYLPVNGLQDFDPGPYPHSKDVLAAIDNFNSRAIHSSYSLVSLKLGFHGKTVGALSLTSNDGFRSKFERILPKNTFIDQDIGQWEKVLSDSRKYLACVSIKNGKPCIEGRPFSNILGFFFEPIQGEGGVNEVSREFLGKVVSDAKVNGIPIVADEIQSGLGRCGSFFAIENFHIVPDFILLSKILGGGVTKIAAILSKKTISEDEFGVLHSSTFAEDEISSRVALKAIDLLQEDDWKWLRVSREKGTCFRKKLEVLANDFPEIIKDVRGVGLLIGIEFHDFRNSDDHLIRFICEQDDFGYLAAGFLLNECGIRVAPTLNKKRTVRVEPSCHISEEEMDRAVDGFRKLCTVLKNRDTFWLIRHLVPEKSQTLELVNDIKDFSRPVENFRQTQKSNSQRIGFLGHFIDPSFLGKHEPPFQRFSSSQLHEILEKTWREVDPCMFVSRDIVSLTGSKVNFNFIGIFASSEIFLNHLKRRDLRGVREKIKAGVGAAKQSGCKLVGFGQFTSILTRNCQEIMDPEVAFTTGNSLTTGMAFRAIQDEVQRRGWKWPDLKIGVLGGGGNIGSILACLIADHARNIILVGGEAQDSQTRLEKTSWRICRDQILRVSMGEPVGPVGEQIGGFLDKAQVDQIHPLEVDRDDKTLGRLLFERVSKLPENDRKIRIGELSEIKHCDVVIAATNTVEPFVEPGHLADEVIVCDISIPSVLSKETIKRAGVTCFKGGVVALPNKERLNIDDLPLETGMVYACMAETILLGLENRWENYSIGDVKKNQVLEILEIADKHGFRLAGLKYEDSL